MGAWEVMLRCGRFDVGATGDEMERIGRKWRREKREEGERAREEREIYFEKNKSKKFINKNFHPSAISE